MILAYNKNCTSPWLNINEHLLVKRNKAINSAGYGKGHLRNLKLHNCMFYMYMPHNVSLQLRSLSKDVMLDETVNDLIWMLLFPRNFIHKLAPNTKLLYTTTELPRHVWYKTIILFHLSKKQKEALVQIEFPIFSNLPMRNIRSKPL